MIGYFLWFQKVGKNWLNFAVCKRKYLPIFFIKKYRNLFGIKYNVDFRQKSESGGMENS